MLYTLDTTEVLYKILEENEVDLAYDRVDAIAGDFIAKITEHICENIDGLFT